MRSFGDEMPCDLARCIEDHFVKSVTRMFRVQLQFLLIVSLLLALVGCATFAQQPASFSHPGVRMAEIQLPEPIVELPAPIVEVAVLEVPFPARVIELHERALVRHTPAEIHCMAEVIYREARGEPEIGQIGVGYVVLNRMGHDDYPKTACGVIADRKHGCQFSWACGGAKARMNTRDYENAERIALLVMNRQVENPVDDSTFFRHKSLRHLGKGRALRIVLGNHRFIASV